MKQSTWWISLCMLLVALPASIAAEAPASFKVGTFTFTRPAQWDWIKLPDGGMRKAQLTPPGSTKEKPAEVVFFHFGPNSGGTQANIQRWFSQFKEGKDKINAKVEETTVGKTKVSYVHAQGTYLSGMPGGAQTPMPDYALLGAILESEEGNVFVKMTGPAAVTKEATPDFKKLVESGLKQ